MPGAAALGRRRALAGVLVTVGAGVGAAWPGVARAEVGAGAYPTSQAVAADAQFLEYAPPPAQPGVVCLVDSGVDPNPDTQAAVIGAEAEVPAWGTGDGLAQTQPLVEGHPAGHGTEMAMIMAAPQNGWGMVGIAPTSVRVYSVRVVPPGVTGFPFSAYSYGIQRCLKLQLTVEPSITVVNLSLSGVTSPANDDLTELEDAVETANLHGLAVVSSAGNDGADTVYYPAAYPTVFAVGSGDAAPGSVGVRCAFSNYGSLDLMAPGCNSTTGGVDQAFEDDGSPALGFGTSQSAALVSAVLAAMRAYEPTLTPEQAEACLTNNAQVGGNIDVAAAFVACGLARVVRAGQAAVPPLAESDPVLGGPRASAPTSPARTMGSTTPIPAVRRLRTPRLGQPRLRGGRLTVTVSNRPSADTFDVKVLAKRRHGVVLVASRRSRSSRMIFKLRTATTVDARFVNRNAVSRWITAKVVD